MSVASASANTILYIDPVAATVNVNEAVVLQIKIDGVVDLFSYNFDLVFDPSILQFVSIEEGDFFPAFAPCVVSEEGEVSPEPCEFPFFVPGEELDSGTVSFTLDTVTVFGQQTGVSGSGILAIATFLAIMPGTSSISIPETVTDPDQPLHDLTFADSESNLITFAKINGASVQVNGVASVPEMPSTMTLLVSVLAVAACRKFTHAS